MATALAYHNTLNVPFHFDDPTAIESNSSIRDLSNLKAVLNPPGDGRPVHGRPMVNLSLAVNYAIGGFEVRGYHLVNIAIHMLNGLLLFALVRLTLHLSSRPHTVISATAAAFFIALLWLLHPLCTQAVTYISQRAESLASLFYLLTLYTLARSATAPGPSARVLWSLAAVAICLTGMLTKETMFTAPLAALFYDRLFLSGTWRLVFRRRWWLHAPLLATMGLPLRAAVFEGKFAYEALVMDQSIGTWQYLLTQAGVILHYLRLALWPIGQCFDYTDWPVATSLATHWPSVTICAAMATGSLLAALRGARWGFPALAFFLILAPSSSVIPIFDLAFEHRMYLPLACLVTLGVLLLDAGARRLPGAPWCRQALVAALCLLAVALGLLTHHRNIVYRSELALWEDVLRQRPANPRAINNLGALLLQAGRYAEAVPMLTRAIAEDPAWQSMSLANRALAQAALGNWEQAIADCDQALAVSPNYATGYATRGRILAMMNQPDAALDDLNAALRLSPGQAEALRARAELYARLQHPAAAIADYDQLLTQGSPLAAELHVARGQIHAARGDNEPALRDFTAAIELQPAYALAYLYRGNLHVRLQRLSEAVADYSGAIASSPSSGEYYNNRAAIRAALGDRPGALADLAECRRLGVTPNPNVAALLETTGHDSLPPALH